jgi:hypothetical protein
MHDCRYKYILSTNNQIHSLFGPLLTHNVVDVGILVFVSICVDFVVATEESSLVESVLARHVSSLTYLV